VIRAALLAGIVLVPAAALAACPSPPGLTVLVPPLERSAGRLEAGLPLSIVAFGSSSTAGNGASSPEASYPARLGAELNTRLPGAEIAVLNRGRGGEDAPEEFARLGRDVVAARPDLVIWQFGTNAVLRRDDLSGDGELVRRGVAELKAAGIDVVLMDLQYAPRVLDRPSYTVMEDIIAETADAAGIGLFRRFALMHYWQRAGDPALRLIADDGLHMNDASYRCLAASLADSLVANWAAHAKERRRGPLVPEAIAGLGQVVPGQ
jgi:lysophospholipase L1-like esterase